MTPRWQYFSLLLLQMILGGQAQPRCTLCANPTIIPKWMDFELQDGRTCKDVYLYVPTMFVGNPQCEVEKDYAQELCCSETDPSDASSTPTPSAVSPPTTTVPPSSTPSATSTSTPTTAPTPSPAADTTSPTTVPTFSPTGDPTLSPTVAPTPTKTPTAAPTPQAADSTSPSVVPTSSPTGGTTVSPTVVPTPTKTPTAAPTPQATDSTSPTVAPTPTKTSEPTPSSGNEASQYSVGATLSRLSMPMFMALSFAGYI